MVGLLGLAAVAVSILPLGRRRDSSHGTRGSLVGGIAAVVMLSGLVTWVVAPGSCRRQLLTDVGRLAPDPARMGVLEARPLFLYPGEWNWLQPWQFFRTGFYVGLAGLAFFSVRVWRDRAAGDLLVWVYVIFTFAATIGQNRFGYYLVTGCALIGGWLATRILDRGGQTTSATVA